jgi:hypothetical protein
LRLTKDTIQAINEETAAEFANSDLQKAAQEAQQQVKIQAATIQQLNMDLEDADKALTLAKAELSKMGLRMEETAA